MIVNTPCERERGAKNPELARVLQACVQGSRVVLLGATVPPFTSGLTAAYSRSICSNRVGGVLKAEAPGVPPRHADPAACQGWMGVGGCGGGGRGARGGAAAAGGLGNGHPGVNSLSLSLQAALLRPSARRPSCPPPCLPVLRQVPRQPRPRPSRQAAARASALLRAWGCRCGAQRATGAGLLGAVEA